MLLLGHSHLDAAWCGRSTKPKGVPRNLRKYYKWLEETHPETFQKVKKKVKEGRWEIVGGAWVESDANMPSGESMVRQFLLGKTYFQKNSALTSRLPDSPTLSDMPRRCLK
jgi:alpha-mannosidase